MSEYKYFLPSKLYNKLIDKGFISKENKIFIEDKPMPQNIKVKFDSLLESEARRE